MAENGSPLVFGDFSPVEVQEGISLDGTKFMCVLAKSEKVNEPKNAVEPKKKPFAWANIIPPKPQIVVPPQAATPPPKSSTQSLSTKSPAKSSTQSPAKSSTQSPAKSSAQSPSTKSPAKSTPKSQAKFTTKSTAKSPAQTNAHARSKGQPHYKKQGYALRVVEHEPKSQPKDAPKETTQPPKKQLSWNTHSSKQPPSSTPYTIVDFVKKPNPPKEKTEEPEPVPAPPVPPKKPFKWGDQVIKPAEPVVPPAPIMPNAPEEKTEETEPVPAPPVPPKKPFKWGDQIITPAEAVAPPTPVMPREFATFEEAFEAALKQLDINALPHDIQKRGFVNQGNTCFQNVTLQALLACPPFLNLLVAISNSVQLPNPKYPAWSHMLQLVQEFEEPILSLQTTLRKVPKKSAFTMPSYFLKAFQSANGIQQDALEFLEFLLDHLHNEFEQSPIVFTKNNPQAPVEDDGWEEIQSNGRVGVVHHNVFESESPITHLFKGTLRSEIRSGRKVSASTIEPFHCVHLTMTTTPQTLEEMIVSSMADEIIETRGIKRTFFETLPVVLTCHIKRFTYDPKLGPLKLNTFVEYPFYLALPKAYFSPKLKQEHAKYKLFAVIAHHGMEAIGGHYTMICCDAMDQWTCFDDDTVVPRTKEGALQENAYLLFYIRVKMTDSGTLGQTLGLVSSSHFTMFDGKSTRGPRVSMSGRKHREFGDSKQEFVAAAQRERFDRAQKRLFQVKCLKIQAFYRSFRARKALTTELLHSLQAKCTDIATLQQMYSFTLPLPVLTRLVQEAVFVAKYLEPKTMDALLEFIKQAWPALNELWTNDTVAQAKWNRRLAVLCAATFRANSQSTSLLELLPQLSLSCIAQWAALSTHGFFLLVIHALQSQNTALYGIVTRLLGQVLDKYELHTKFAQTILTIPLSAQEAQFRSWLDTSLSWKEFQNLSSWRQNLSFAERAIVLGNLLELAHNIAINDGHRSVLLAFASQQLVHLAYPSITLEEDGTIVKARPQSLETQYDAQILHQLELWTNPLMLSKLLQPSSIYFLSICTQIYAEICVQFSSFFFSKQLLVPPTCLSSLLFAFSESSVLSSLFQSLSTDSSAQQLWVLFSGAFVQHLHTCDDLSLVKHFGPLVQVVELMKIRLYHILWLNTNAQNTPTTLTSMELLDLSLLLKLWNLLYVRNTRINFTSAPNAWLWPSSISLQQFALELTDEDGIPLDKFFESPLVTRLHFILTTIPQVISFETRVQFFNECINREKANIPGRHIFGQIRPLRIRRDHMIQDSFEAFDSIFVEQGAGGIKSRMQVTFVNAQGLEEAGVDGGGVFKEYLDLLTKQAFSTNCPYFLTTDDQLIYPNPNAQNVLGPETGHHFRFLGRVLAKAMYEGILIEPQFATFFLQKLLGQLNTLDDLQSLDAELYRHVLKMKQSPESIDQLELTYSIATSQNGTMQIQELIPQGQNIPVTQDNFIRYIHLLANYKLNTQIAAATNAFLVGFHDVIPTMWLLMFSPMELQMLIGGATHDVNVDDWKANTLYGGGYHPSQPIVQWFWEVVFELTSEERGELLKFITSCSRQPLLGFKQLQPLICIQQVRISDDERLPSSATCMNLLKLPTYSSKEVMKSKLLYAIHSKAGFELS
ncbi:HECT E3 ubiquitin ligase [Thraustotheca clavata]|uniref:HECT-type E3 ubiquitin transferase n=1 Tax=Thraustotheca clavata TaxID=74557 RepID=A0A1V9ZYX8_9STRA|nr:HECT E3 ubiquitin ligase [Thraustotheca clavata]